MLDDAPVCATYIPPAKKAGTPYTAGVLHTLLQWASATFAATPDGAGSALRTSETVSARFLKPCHTFPTQTLQKQYYIPEKNLLAAIKRQPKVRAEIVTCCNFQRRHQHWTGIS